MDCINSSISQRACGDEIRVVPYSPQYKPQIVELLNASLQRKLVGERDAAYWDWKHEQNPFGTSLLLLAECDGTLVGLRAFMRWRLTAEGNTIHVAKPVDSVTHPDYQRRGIFSKLTLQACDVARDQGVEFLFNTPNDNSKPGYLKLGWQPVDALPLFLRPLRPMSAGWRLARWKLRQRTVPNPQDFFREEPVTADAVFGDAGISTIFNTQHTSTTRQRVDQLPDKTNDSTHLLAPRARNDSLGESTHSLAPRACNDSLGISRLVASPGGHRLATERTADFLRWRYCQHPHIRYYVECVEGNCGLDGVLVYRTNFRQGLREIMIDDILLAKDRREIVAELFRKLCSRVTAEYVLAHFSRDAAPGTHLRSLGFWQLPRRRIALVAKVLNEPVQPDPRSASSWSLCMGDFEGL